MATDRLEVRLRSEDRCKLDEIAAAQGVSVSEAVRRTIKAKHEELAHARRAETVRVIASLCVEDVPDPETINRQSESSYGVTVLP